MNKLCYFVILSSALWMSAVGRAQQVQVDNPVPVHEPREVQRFALVIGAQNYDYLEPAANALNDALEIVRVLRQAHFSFIRFVPNPRDEVEIAEYMRNLHDWTGDSNEPVIIVFFYAGHGFMSKDRRPYIVPTTARPGHLLEDSVPLSSVLSDISFHHSGISFFLFDACRTGIPESASNADQLTAMGLQPSVSKLRSETYIHFATEEGAPAQSSAGSQNSNNSAFTNELITYFPRPEISARQVFDKVHAFVPIHTGNSQFTIEVLDGVLTNLYMLPSDRQRLDDKAAWEKTLATNIDDCIKDFITEYPGSPYLSSALAWHRLDGTVDNSGGANGCEAP